MDSPLVRTSAMLGALLVVLRFYLAQNKKKAKPSPYVTNFEEVAQKIKMKDGEYGPDEYDVVIVGGGASRLHVPEVGSHVFG